MSVASIFDFRFTPEHTDEGLELARSIGVDMTKTSGYARHEVVRDLTDAGHVVVMTQWEEQGQGEAVLEKYIHDEKISRAAELIGGQPSGFLGEIL